AAGRGSAGSARLLPRRRVSGGFFATRAIPAVSGSLQSRGWRKIVVDRESFALDRTLRIYPKGKPVSARGAGFRLLFAVTASDIASVRWKPDRQKSPARVFDTGKRGP